MIRARPVLLSSIPRRPSVAVIAAHRGCHYDPPWLPLWQTVAAIAAQRGCHRRPASGPAGPGVSPTGISWGPSVVPPR